MTGWMSEIEKWKDLADKWEYHYKDLLARYQNLIHEHETVMLELEELKRAPDLGHRNNAGSQQNLAGSNEES